MFTIAVVLCVIAFVARASDGAIVRASASTRDGARVDASFAQRHAGAPTFSRIVTAFDANALKGDIEEDIDVEIVVAVHALANDGGGCDARAIGEVYDARASRSASGETNEKAIGDVSARNGLGVRLGREQKTVTYVDMDFPLAGERGVAGRTLAVWRGTSAKDATFANGKMPMMCARLVRDDDDGGDVVVARAVVGTTLSKVSGVVTFSQSAKDATRETTVRVELVNRAQGETSSGHEWGIYDMPAGTAGSCARVGEVYNPSQKASCAAGTNRLAEDCPLGELSRRQGALSAPMLAMFTDGNLPLSGKKSIIGKSLVLFAKDGGADKMLCSDVKLVSAAGGGRGGAPAAHMGVIIGVVAVLLLLAVCSMRYYSAMFENSSFFDWMKLNRSHMTFQRLSEEFKEVPLASPPRSPARPGTHFTILDESDNNGALNHDTVKRRARAH